MNADQLESSIILHELSNIGAILQGGVHMLEFSEPNSPAAKVALGTVTRGATRLSETLSALKDLWANRHQPSTEVSRSMLAFVREFAGDSLIWHGKNSVIHVSGDGSEPEVFAPALVQMILRNLLANALKYSPEGSRVDVRVKHSATETRILVRNYGKMIPPAVKARLFTPACKGENGGSGMGLYIAQCCANIVSGTIRCRSSARHTVFCLSLTTRRQASITPWQPHSLMEFPHGYGPRACGMG